MGFFEPSKSQADRMQEAAGELVATVTILEELEILTHLNGVKRVDEQLFLDYVGDSAHALRGLDLATGTTSIAY